jgi:hypothetical protein
VAISVIFLAAMVKFGKRKEINLLLRLWLILVPFAFGFAERWSPLINYVLDGLILVAHTTFQLLDAPKRRQGAF